jgi:predicted ArsR family transcriptional regulator
MDHSEARRLQVDRFILEQIDTVPHLEALLLLFNSRPKAWSTDEMAKSLYVRNEVASKILDSLLHRNLIAVSPNQPDWFFYSTDDEGQNKLLHDVDAIYRKEVVRISSMIHSKASAGVRDFARAFRFKKDDKE